jgi:esterase/lipase
MSHTIHRKKRKPPRSFQTKRKKIHRRRGGGLLYCFKRQKKVTIATPTKKRNTFLKRMYYNLFLEDYDQVQENKKKRAQFEKQKSAIFGDLITDDLDPFAKILTDVNKEIASIKDNDNLFNDQTYNMFLKLINFTEYVYNNIGSTFFDSNYKIYRVKLLPDEFTKYIRLQQQQIANERTKLDLFYEENTKQFKVNYNHIQKKINVIKTHFSAYEKNNNPTKEDMKKFNDLPYKFSSLYYDRFEWNIDNYGNLHDLYQNLYQRKTMIEHLNEKAKELRDNYQKQSAPPPVKEEMVPPTTPEEIDEFPNEEIAQESFQKKEEVVEQESNQKGGKRTRKKKKRN